MKQTVQERAEEMREAWGMEDNHGYGVKDTFKVGFVQGANWQSEQSPWVSVKERLPDDDENIIIMCEHGAIFNGTYCNGVWFCMDGYLHDTYKGNPLYSSMTGIPPLWEPTAWMPIPKFNE